jgi:hypothetical protein
VYSVDSTELLGGVVISCLFVLVQTDMAVSVHVSVCACVSAIAAVC